MSSPVSTSSMIGLSASLMGLSVIAVGLRFYARRLLKISLGIDDWLMIPALACLIASAVTYIIGGANHQLGNPTDFTEPGAEEGLSDQIVFGYKAEYVALILQPWILGLVKTSIVLFYRRVFCTGQRTWFSIFTAAFISLTVIWTLAFFFAILFDCGTDIQAGWGTYDEFKAHCDNTVILDEVYSIIDFILDLVVFIMPLPMIWRLQMSTHRRLAVSLVFVIGALALIASILRMAVIINIAQGNGQNTEALGSNDPSLQTATFLYWTMLEQGLATIVACLPTLKVLFSLKSLESVVRSVRSMLSLDSLQSQGSRRNGQLYHRQTATSIRTVGSQTAMTNRKHPEDDLEEGEAEPPIPMVPQLREALKAPAIRLH